MAVYADILFAVNTVVNYLLLLLGARLTGYPARPLRTLLGAVVGGGYAICVLVPSLAFLRTWWGKCLCFLLMAMTAYGFRRKAVTPGAVSLLCGGALAGFVFLITQLFTFDVITFQGHIYYPIAAKMLILMSGIFYLAAAILMAGTFKHRLGEITHMELFCGNRSIQVSALYDSGNTLEDPVAGKPVIVLEWNRGAELLGVAVTKELFLDPAAALEYLQEKCPFCRMRLLPYRSVGTDGALLVAMPCSIKIGKRKRVSVLAALSATSLSDGGGYEALVGGSLF